MTNTTQPITSKGTIKTITIIYYAYSAALIIFGAVALFITKNADIKFTDTDDVFFYLVPVFAIIIGLLSHFLFQKNLEKVHQQKTLQEKLTHYQSTRIIRYAMLEAPALFGIVVFKITSNQFYLIISAVILVYSIFLRPTKEIIKEELKLTKEQEREFIEALKH